MTLREAHVSRGGFSSFFREAEGRRNNTRVGVSNPGGIGVAAGVAAGLHRLSVGRQI